MPYLQPASLVIFGFQPAYGNARTNVYPVSSSEATAILPGDVIVWTTIATAKAAVTASTGRWCGVAAAALSTASFAGATANLLVYDDPHTVFAAAVTTSAGMGSTMMYQGLLIVTTATGTGVPSSLVSRSKHALGVVASSGGLLKMVGLHPIESVSSGGYVLTSGVSTPQKFLVMPHDDAAAYGPLTT